MENDFCGLKNRIGSKIEIGSNLIHKGIEETIEEKFQHVSIAAEIPKSEIQFEELDARSDEQDQKWDEILEK